MGDYNLQPKRTMTPVFNTEGMMIVRSIALMAKSANTLTDQERHTAVQILAMIRSGHPSLIADTAYAKLYHQLRRPSNEQPHISDEKAPRPQAVPALFDRARKPGRRASGGQNRK